MLKVLRTTMLYELFTEPNILLQRYPQIMFYYPAETGTEGLTLEVVCMSPHSFLPPSAHGGHIRAVQKSTEEHSGREPVYYQRISSAFSSMG